MAKAAKIIRWVSAVILGAIIVALVVLVAMQFIETPFPHLGWDYQRAEIIDNLFIALFFFLGLNFGLWLP